MVFQPINRHYFALPTGSPQRYSLGCSTCPRRVAHGDYGVMETSKNEHPDYSWIHYIRLCQIDVMI